MRVRVGHRVRELRKSLGLTQERLAEKSGMNAKYFSAVERGEVNLTLELLERICKALDVPAVEIFREPVTPAGDDADTVRCLVHAILDQRDPDRTARLRLFLEHVFR